MSVSDFQAWLTAMRTQSPVQANAETGVVDVFGYPECRAALAKTEEMSCDFVALADGQFDPFADGNLLRMDPPKHTHLRRIVGSVLTPKAFEVCERRVAEIADRLLDDTGAEFDFVEDFAAPLPVIAIAELLDLPLSDLALFRRWSDVLQATALPGEEMNNYFLEHVKRHRATHGDDMTSRLVRAEVDGQTLSDSEIAGFIGILLFAGNSTTTALLGNSVLLLDERPEIAAELRARRDLIPSAIEEFLRLLPPFSSIARQAAEGFELGGVRVHEGQMVRLWVSAANRDPRQFGTADSIDVRREPNRHLAFGRGIHFCLGAPLARLETRVALNRIFDRFTGLAVVGEPEMANPMIMASAKRIPVSGVVGDRRAAR